MTVWRAAVYAAPGFGRGSSEADARAARLREHAEKWLGRAIDGRAVPPCAPSGWVRDEVDAITVAARSYGFHGTLKPPFRLAAGRSLDELACAVADLAARTPAVSIPRLRLGRLESFFALVPGVDDQPLRSVADAVVTGLDTFRAPLTDEDRARRNPDALTPRQRELLERWGYPYVLDEFRFHLTLTDRIPDDRRSEVGGVLQSWFADVLGHDIPLDVLTVLIQETPGAPFRLHSVHPMTFGTARPEPVAPASRHPGASAQTAQTAQTAQRGITR
ncbi:MULTISPECIES: DUF1045 domain-containing protein [Gordonia]|uniref:DUF1045 domain-containing protein n=1 Tax=Gordonia TaxID=2053 RepID=UPI00133178BE|nr:MULTISPECIES: DUF1045 domain-containing protein [Gordonia]KAF0968273.1 hypothetical protein BPODLACK_03214 [Gordonia sp. YY1]UPW14173.1 DUF1045 domain-containing protein [Gordonia amicalis]